MDREHLIIHTRHGTRTTLEMTPPHKEEEEDIFWRRRVNTNSQQLDNIICNHDSTQECNKQSQSLHHSVTPTESLDSGHDGHDGHFCTGFPALATTPNGNVINLPISHYQQNLRIGAGQQFSNCTWSGIVLSMVVGTWPLCATEQSSLWRVN